MKEYTVVLLRPEYLNYLTGKPYGKDIYVAHISAQSEIDAIPIAQQNAFIADSLNFMGEDYIPEKFTDYEPCAVFEGHHKPIAF